ncbi:sigma-70 region 4 domain-containing protein [Erythrobacter sp. LQ02-29]|uniref:sigma-70 region 4 domain-containing protein n=1 Tax=Erythrobacter sp. LQ02-29 TaxID=2920384 RepID=UPI001F4E2203|nr:sigma-70 region 4 domain-containing protein [Erythrobacter sp. LQ02-29]MCP9223421.1 sigma-70 region 4 domain-containing protein [Erythrobacter sp. LQ02-29]
MLRESQTLSELTDKQFEALQLAAEHHLSSKEIALRLDVSPSAVDQRIEAARRVLCAGTRAEACRAFLLLRENDSYERATADFAQVPSAPHAEQFGPDEADERRSGRAWFTGLVPGLRHENLGKLERTVLIAVGAVALAICLAIVTSLALVFDIMF